MSKKTFRIVAVSVCAFILVVVLAVNIAVGIFSGLIDKFVIGYKDGSNSSAARAEGAALAEQIQEEGTVLVQNNDDVLPLSKTATPQVNVFGWAVTDWVISGSGSGQVKRGASTDFLEALTEYGIDYNTEITDMYARYRPNREFSINGSHAGSATEANPGGSGSLHSFNYEFSRLYEPSIDDTSYYTDSMLTNAEAYSDTAIVVIGRVSGESNDSPKVQYKGDPGTGKKTGMPAEDHIDKTRTYLEISTEEEALLEYVGETYENVIVLINSTNVMELGFMETIPGLDSCLVVATTGSAGAKAIPGILYGDINPSGKLADTYAYDLSTSSTYVDTGSGNDTTNFYTNSDGLYPTGEDHTNGSSTVKYQGVAYTDYRESVYMGYRWYETADTMGFWDDSYAENKWGIENGYEDVVQYPFGYGLSYTEFEWNITYLEIPNGTSISLDGEDNSVIKVGVTVTNVGDVAGQDVVELYYSAPYDQIEKSSVVLGAYGKTQQVLDPGESEYVELVMDVSDMCSYDYLSVKVPGGGYVLEAGTYTLTLRSDAHTVANDKVVRGDNNVHANATLTYTVSKDQFYLEDTVHNRFTGEDAGDGVAIDGNSDGTAQITYLSRANFKGTFPAKQAENRAMDERIMQYNLFTEDQAKTWADEHSDALPVTFGDTSKSGVVYEDGKINELGMQLGMNYDDPAWDDLLDRISKSEMTGLVLNAYTETRAINSIGKPATVDFDGPNQAGSFAGTVSVEATGFSSIVLAQTWNVQLAYSMGLAFGTECISYGIQGWYGPGLNLHRSPFGGRNYEYYSEDTLISGSMAANVVKAAKNKGVFAYLKHLCLYETESGRDGMYTWLTEQALRELYLKPFEMAVTDGGSNAMMTSYGRIGAVWTGGSKTLLEDVVEGEWGFRGAFLTDYSDHTNFMDPDAMIRAGGDLFMRVGGGSFDYETSSDAFNNALRDSTKDVVYMWLNSLATNADYNAKIESGEIDDDVTIPTSPELNFRWYIPVLVVVDVLAVGGCGTWLFFAFRKKKAPAQQETQQETQQ